MDRRTLYALVIVGAAAFGYYLWSNHQASKDQQPTDTTAVDTANQYYAAPPMFSAQPNPDNQVWINQKQAMPLPYNT